MTFTYGFGIDTDLNKTRLLIRDTNSTNVMFEDEELNQFLGMAANPFGAAGLAARTMQAVNSGKADKTVGELSIKYSGVATAWGKLADELDTKGKTKGSPQLFAGGISASNKLTQEQDSDRVDPAFYRDIFDFPGTVISSTNR
jgi:hypothetical protein